MRRFQNKATRYKVNKLMNVNCTQHDEVGGPKQIYTITDTGELKENVETILANYSSILVQNNSKHKATLPMRPGLHVTNCDSFAIHKTRQKISKKYDHSSIKY